jgi:hypothetical protein
MGSGFFISICLTAVIFLLPLFSRELRKSGSIIIAYSFVIFLHQFTAFLNNSLVANGHRGTFGAENDANVGFHPIAKELALRGEMHFRGQDLSIPISLESFLKGGSIYYELLGSLYSWFGTSVLVGAQLSILAFAFSCIIFLKIIRQLGIEHYTVSSLLCFGAMPSMVLLGSVTLREPFQVLFFMLTIYAGLRISMQKKLNTSFFFLMLISVFVMGAFHKALMVYGVFLVFIFLIWSRRPISRIGNIKKLHLIAMMLIPFFLYIIVIISKSAHTAFQLFQPVLDTSSQFHLVSIWRKASGDSVARSSYSIPLDFSSPLAVLNTFLMIYSYYHFPGYSLSLGNPADVFAALEATFRLILICFSVLGWSKAVGFQKRLLGLMLFLYISMSFLWAVGTTNYGTAIRHHMLTWWIISILGVPPLLDKLKHAWLAQMRRD